MAEKRYYWLKLMGDFFTQPKIKKLRRMAGGDTYTIIYLKLQLLSLKNEGVLFFEGIEETFVKELALTMDEEEEDVQATLAFMGVQKLIVQISEEEFLLPETVELIGSEAASTIRSQKSRNKKKALLLESNADATNCNADATNCNGDIESNIYKSEKEYNSVGQLSSFGAPLPPGMTMEEFEQRYKEMTT